MKKVYCWLMVAFTGISSPSTFAQSSVGPGPAVGGVNHSYDDGYVYVDITGDAGGYTWNWGYQSSSQIHANFLVFTSETNLDANTIQVITDTYYLGGIIPPPAPYSGSFNGPGPLLPDTPSRSIEDIAVPEPSSVVMLSLGALVLIGWAYVGKTKNAA